MTFGKAEEAMKVFKYCIQDLPPEACSSEFKGQNWYVLFFCFFLIYRNKKHLQKPEHTFYSGISRGMTVTVSEEEGKVQVCL